MIFKTKGVKPVVSILAIRGLTFSFQWFSSC